MGGNFEVYSAPSLVFGSVIINAFGDSFENVDEEAALFYTFFKSGVKYSENCL